MVQSAKDRLRDNVSESLDRACAGCVLAKRKVRPHLIIVAGVFRKNPAKVFFVEHDHVVRTLASRRPDQALNKAVLPGRAEGCRPVSNTHRSDASFERSAEGSVIVANEILRCRVPWASVSMRLRPETSISQAQVTLQVTAGPPGRRVDAFQRVPATPLARSPSGRGLGLPRGSPIGWVPLPISWDAFPGLGETDAFPSSEKARVHHAARRSGGLAAGRAGAAAGRADAAHRYSRGRAVA